MKMNEVMAQGQPAAEEQDSADQQVVPEDQEPQQSDQSQPTPEEADAYERVVLAGVKMISEEPTHKSIMNIVADEKGGPLPRRLAKAAVTVIEAIDEQSKGTIPEIVIPPASAEILENVAEFAKASGSVQVDQQVLGRAGQYLVAELAETYGASEEDLAYVTQGMSEEDISATVQEQNSYDPQAQQGGQPAPSQELPGIINKTLGE